jgi:nitric oxide synthase-interacting protein
MSPPSEPTAKSTKTETHVRCPMSGNRLRLKDLLPVKLETASSESGYSPQYVCSVSKRPITHQKAVLLKPSGLVVLETVYEEIIKPTGRCPITGMAVKPEDVLPLHRSGTTFALSGNTEVKRDVAVKSRAFEGGTRGLRI